MTEAQISFLYKAATIVARCQTSNTHQKLQSYYLMRCKEITRGFGLPKKYFSKQIRCPHCCSKWNDETETRLNSIKLSKRQRRRIRSNASKMKNKNKQYLLHSNELEKICAFCSHSIKTPVQKPNTSFDHTCEVKKDIKTDNMKVTKTINNKKDPKLFNKELQSNVYYNSNEAFSLSREKNNISGVIKDPPKIIKNNKKRKDKFAGLCQKAVLSAAKMKQEKDKKNKLNLFLKPV